MPQGTVEFDSIARGMSDPGVPVYSGAVPAGCRFWQEGTRRIFATVPRDHEHCAIGVYPHHMESQNGGGHVRPDDMPFIPVLEREGRLVPCGPLGSSPVSADVVLLCARADQGLILAVASQQMEGGLPPAMGRPACAIVLQGFNTGRTALSPGCCGARACLDLVTPDVALYAIPGSKLKALAERVMLLARANAVGTKFHSVRREHIAAGEHPSFKESLEAIQ